MIITIDISQLEKTRSNTGIQRVIKEFLQRLISDKKNIKIQVVSYNIVTHQMEVFNNKEILLFLHDIEHYQFQSREVIYLETEQVQGLNIFFDIDSVWLADLKREKLYPTLKANGYLIFNFIHDLIPIVMPSVVHHNTLAQFKPFLNAVYQNSDMVFFNSHSSKKDFFHIKKSRNIQQEIPSRVISLGADFLKKEIKTNTQPFDSILSKKYILFVGTLEPRKSQVEMLDAFEVLAEKYSDLHLVFIGKQGWNVEPLIQRIKSHRLNHRTLHWLNNIDDNQLIAFYKNAFIVTYLSKYEGYGLPIVESLQYGNITIASRNSSMYEVGRNFSDYIVYGAKNELVDIVSLYYETPLLYEYKKTYIKENFKSISWDKAYNSLKIVFNNYEKSTRFRDYYAKNLQFVFISIHPQSLEGTIEAIDKHINFVKEYIVITQSKLIESFKKIKTNKKLIIIDESLILKKYINNFHHRDHQSKNWLLRVSLLNLKQLDEQFIMLDDDNRPIKNIELNYFISDNGRYKAYYFYNLLNWHHTNTDYDKGQQNTKNILIDKNYELFSYSVHAPQIINRAILEEVAENFFDIGLNQSIDEWSIYFNYAVSNYPSLFEQKIFQTLNWPDDPCHWEYDYSPENFSFENYYQHVYDEEIFIPSASYQEKVAFKREQLEPYSKARNIFNKNIPRLAAVNAVSGVLYFKSNDLDLYLFNIPQFIDVLLPEKSNIRLQLNYKIINKNLKKNNIEISVGNKEKTTVSFKTTADISYIESIIEIPFHLAKLEKGTHDIVVTAKINNEVLCCEKSGNPTIAFSADKGKPNTVKFKKREGLNMSSLKRKIKKLAFVSRVARWGYNIVRINTLKYTLSIRIDETNKKQEEYNKKQEEYNKKQEEYNKKQAQIDYTIENKIREEIAKQSILFHQRINDLQQATIKKESKLTNTPSNFILDDYYLAFENKFRGSREEIKARYQKYLSYLNPSIETALDIGCGRGEWVGLLQEKGIKAQGIDLNLAMINEGITQGARHLKKIDAFDFFRECQDDSFDLVTAFHIIEHIPYQQLFIFLQEINRISKPNAIILLETPNPANLLVAAFEFYKDPTHLNPLPSDVIAFMVEYMGFSDIKIKTLHPFPDHMRLTEESQTAEQLNHYLYQDRDYLIIAKNNKQQAKQALKLKLAFVSPLPPQQSGIAYYSAELLTALSKYYDIEVISNQNDSAINQLFKTQSFDWLKHHSHQYDRILYHIGNSKFHIEMIPLLKKTAGVIVLHDFYLDNLMAQANKLNSNLFYQQYGYQSLVNTAENYPCNKSMLNDATGVIVHSDYAKKLSLQWYQEHDSTFSNWSKIPLFRVPPSETDSPNKKQLDLATDAFIVCSFGLLRPNKGNQQLLDAWLNSSLCQNKDCHLIFVGETDAHSNYGKQLEQTILRADSNNPIRITGWVNDSNYKDYLGIADLGVQLRSNSTGESSATVLDCMNYRVPLIVNANGSNQELPEDAVYLLEDKFKQTALIEALEILYSEKKQRSLLADNAQKHITEHHQPKHCAKLYYQAIEDSYQNKNTFVESLFNEIEDKKSLVKAITLSKFEQYKQKQILVDISSIVRTDLKTGIQRVVRSQVMELIKNAPLNYRIEPVYLSLEPIPTYYYAKAYTTKLLKLDNINILDTPISLNKGDIFYGLDLNSNEVEIATDAGIYQYYKLLDVQIVFMVYDLLPILYPHFFPANIEGELKSWLKNISETSDQLICISEKVANDVRTHTDNKTLLISSLHLGADIPQLKKITSSDQSKSANKQTISFLMVGTVEPRKGHQEVLEAFEELWKQGFDISLTIVGKKGWMMAGFIETLNHHPQKDTHLFYLEFVSDQILNQLYIDSDCLIAASIDEGFGLPLIEGAHHNIPLIARDIEVFREVATEYAYYFQTDELANAIKKWIVLYQQEKHPLSNEMPYLTWKQNAQDLLAIFDR